MSTVKSASQTKSPANTSAPSSAEQSDKATSQKARKVSKSKTSPKLSTPPTTPAELNISPYQLATLAHSMSRHKTVTDVDLLDAVSLLERAHDFLQNISSEYPSSFKDLLSVEGKKISGKPRVLGLITNEGQLESRIKVAFANRSEREAFDHEWLKWESRWADRIWHHGSEDEKDDFDEVLYSDLIDKVCRKLNIEPQSKWRSLSSFGSCRSSEEILKSKVFKGRDEIEIITWACNDGKSEMSASEVLMGLKKPKKRAVRGGGPAEC